MTMLPDSTEDLPSPKKKWIRRILAVLTISVAAISIVASLNGRWDELKVSEFTLPSQGVMVLIVGITGTLILSAIYHTLLLPAFQVHQAPPIRVAYAYALSQLLRYVPGKIVGVVFQISMLQGKVRPASVLATLIVHTAHDYSWALVFCGLLLWSAMSNSGWPLLVFLPVLLAAHLVHKHQLSQRLLIAMPVIGRHVPAGNATTGAYNPALLTGILAATWVPMIAGMWLAFTPLLGHHGSLMAGLLYLIAAVLSLAIIVIPSGVVVREAVFMWLGGLVLLPPEKLLFIAVVARIAMTLSEVATTLLLAATDAWANHRRKT